NLGRRVPGLVEPEAQQPYGRRGNPGSDKVTQLLFATVAADCMRRLFLKHLVGPRRVKGLAIAAAGGVEPEREPARGGKIGKAPCDGDGVRQLATEIVDQNGERLVREDLAKHLGRSDRRTGVTDQRVRHRSETPLLREISRGCIGSGANKT